MPVAGLIPGLPVWVDFSKSDYEYVVAGPVTLRSFIKSDREISSPRIHKSEQTSAQRFHHEVKLTSPAEVDSELVKWLKDAYELSG